MVATRRGAKKAPEAAPAASASLNAPPKRGGRKKAVVEDTAEPAPAVTKPTKTTAAKRKAVSEPEAAELPAAKKPAANSKVSRAPKVEMEAQPAPAAAKRPTRGRKATEPAVEEKPAVVEEAPKPNATRGRKAAAKKTPAAEVEQPAVVDEPVIKEAPKPAPRARKAPVKKAPATKKGEVPEVEQTVAVEPVKPAPRGRKAAAPTTSAPVLAPVINSRATRGRNAAALPQDSPLKAPARKPAKKTAATKSKAEPTPAPQPEPTEEPFAEFPGYPSTPAHIVAPLTAKQAMDELPHYPTTPAHIKAPITNKAALAEMPDYPKTPAHIKAPITNKAALAEMPEYPKTPAHIKAPITNKAALAEMAGYPKTPAHIKAPISVLDAMAELPDYPKTPAHISAPIASQSPAAKAAMDVSLHSFHTPSGVEQSYSNNNASEELPGTPSTPARIQTPPTSKNPFAKLPLYPETPAHIVAITATTTERATDGPSTPVQFTTPPTGGASEVFGSDQMPSNIVWGVTNQEAFAEMPEYPNTPAHIKAPITSKQALAELPDYPKTPAHIAAPISSRDALAELPSYPTTPAMTIEAAIQEEITASVKKQTPSPLRFSGFDDVSFQSAESSEYTVDSMDVDEPSAHELIPRKPLAPLQLAPPQLAPSLAAPEPMSPKKSALRSPQKMDPKTPKKAVTWDDAERSELLHDGPLLGMTFYVDVKSNGRDQNYLFASLLEDLGAKTTRDWETKSLGHVLFKDGNMSTLEKVIASKGAIKCVNVGWVLDSEKNKTRMDEAPYLIDLSVAMPASPPPKSTFKPFTPARTPSKYALPPSSVSADCRSVPSTPTSSEFDRSMNFDDKENVPAGIFFDSVRSPPQAQTVPPKKSSFLLSRSAIKTPSKPNFLSTTPVKPASVMRPFSTIKKRTHQSSFPGITWAPPKKLRLV